jgi:phage shock protein A
MEHEEQARELEREVDKLEEHSDEVGEQIEETRREWEAKEQDPSIPGAQPDPLEEEESVPGVAADEETLSEEGGP